MRDETEKFTLVIHHETDRAWLVSENGEDDDAFWIPKSKCELTDKKPQADRKKTVAVFDIPEWLAMERDLI